MVAFVEGLRMGTSPFYKCEASSATNDSRSDSGENGAQAVAGHEFDLRENMRAPIDAAGGSVGFRRDIEQLQRELNRLNFSSSLEVGFSPQRLIHCSTLRTAGEPLNR